MRYFLNVFVDASIEEIEATLKAAQESEDAESIDESVEDDVLIPEAAAETEADTSAAETETETPEAASDAETE